MQTNSILTYPVGRAVGLTSPAPTSARNAVATASPADKSAKPDAESLAALARTVIRQGRIESVAWLAVALAALAILVLSLSLRA